VEGTREGLAATDKRVPPDGRDGPAAYQALRADRPAAVLRIAQILGELLVTNNPRVPSWGDRGRIFVLPGQMGCS
jgi:hypothetical protein